MPERNEILHKLFVLDARLNELQTYLEQATPDQVTDKHKQEYDFLQQEIRITWASMPEC